MKNERVRSGCPFHFSFSGNPQPLGETVGEIVPEMLDRVTFFGRLAGYGALPVLALIGAQFPQVGGLLASVLEPAVKALH